MPQVLDRPVQETMEQVVLVDENDTALGLAGKVDAHLGQGQLHRAFTVLVFDSVGRTLVARRSSSKMLWPKYWDSACASHPREGEGYESAGERRLLEELGFSCQLSLIDKFVYQVPFHTIGAEHELCATLVGVYDGELHVNEDEVAEYRWLTIAELLGDMEEHPNDYAPWFTIALERALADGSLVFANSGAAAVFDNRSVKRLLDASAALVEPCIRTALASSLRVEHQEPMLHQMGAGGKRIRPALVVTSCLMLDGSLDDAISAGAAIEILHNSTLIADDMIDHSEIRRGEPTVWKKYGRSFAECAVLAYNASIFEAVAHTDVAGELMPLCASTLKTVVEGELLDIRFERAGREDEPFVVEQRFDCVTPVDYGDMIYAKTAALFETSCAAGAICAKAPAEQVALLSRFGRYLGMAFQVRDDILDVFGDQKVFGKQIGRDIYDHKAGNVVLLTALDELKDAERDELCRLMSIDELTPQDVEEAIRLIRRSKAHQLCQKLADDFTHEARTALEDFPDNRWKLALLNLVDELLVRSV